MILRAAVPGCDHGYRKQRGLEREALSLEKVKVPIPLPPGHSSSGSTTSPSPAGFCISIREAFINTEGHIIILL